jgi:hypothetical protein
MFRQRRVERRDHGGIDEIRFRPIKPQPQQLAFRFEPDFERLRHNYALARG